MTNTDFIKQLEFMYPHVEILLPESEAYSDRRVVYALGPQINPAAIAVPKNAAEVASLVKFAVSESLPFTIRNGGHDPYGRQMVQDVLTIDLRKLDSVTVDRTAGTATIGGGVLFERLVEVLAEHDCITPTGNIGSVGYVGWATTGGYGQMAAKYGLGIDHILAAKIVNAEGDVVDADSDILKGIRGACGNFGVIVEATIKIYPFSKILAGTIIFESTDYATTIQLVHDGIEAMKAADDLPPEIDLQPAYANSPLGPIFGVIFCWGSPDIERGKQYLEKIAALAPVLMNSVVPCTAPELFAVVATFSPAHTFVSARSVGLRTASQKVLEVVKKHCGLMPADLGAVVTWHELRTDSPSANKERSLLSVFGARQPHYILEILACAVEQENLEAVTAWGLTFRDEILEKASEEVLESQWVPMTPAGELKGPEKVYGSENAEFLRMLKKEKDPKNVFRYAIPSLI
ncbi:FAD-binding domain-containing protein 73 [Elsinoe fawcettii]|nr:FAD-binding domain-containing protein 73 [Elsinoe fawcettii]